MSSEPGGAVLGVDIGGTFTDIALACPGGRLVTGKYLTTSHDPGSAVLAGISDVLARSGVAPGEVGRVVHATTLATNTILERRGVDVAFITTRGFRDMLALGRQARVEEDRYDLMADGAELPLPLSHCFEVNERVGAGGKVLRPFDEEQARGVARDVAGLGVRAVAICLLHSYANPAHERRMAELCQEAIAAADGQAVVVTSHEVWPVVREYERGTTTLMSAYVGPVMSGYLSDLHNRLQTLGIRGPLHMMDSSGGVMPARRAAAVAVRTIESGPAAGVVAARAVGLATGRSDLLAFDMGGTTAKAGIVRGGRTAISRDFQVGGKGSFGGRRAGTGLPVKVPAVDLAEVGSGGGSIAWVDDAGALRVGPHSAGSHPGPACYGFGGGSATVTDADLVLGYLDPDSFAGGTLQLRPELAEKAVDELARRLGASRLQAAHAIVAIANAAMGFAVQVVTVSRGIDPRRFAMVASGGAGPMHAARIAERFAITTILVPHAPGVGSAEGLLDCDLAAERSQALPRPMLLADAAGNAEVFAAAFAELEAAARGDLSEEGQQDAGLVVARELDVRYRGQAFELAVRAPAGPFGTAAAEAISAEFTTAYEAAYGSRLEGVLEVVSSRVHVTRKVPPSGWVSISEPGDPLIGYRSASFDASAGYDEVPVYGRERLPAGFSCAGPAIITDAGSTTIVPPGWSAHVEPNLTLRLAASS